MKPTLNLASRSYLNRQLLYAGYGFAVVVLVAALAAAGGYLWSSRQQAATFQRDIAQLQAQLGSADESAPKAVSGTEIQRLRERVTFANGVLRKDAFRWTALLDKLETVVPDGVGLRRIQPEYRGGSLQIDGLARNLATLKEFLDNLLVSPDFSSALLLHQARLDAQAGLGRDALGFTVVLKGAF